MNNVFFIAEVSSNHNKDLERCLDFIDSAAEIGCDAVKFQLFRINKLFAQIVLENSLQHQKRKEWELPIEFLKPLSNRAKEKGIKFSCTPFDLDAVDSLKPFVDFYKIASYELLWDDLLIKCAKTGKEVIISTGMANIDEIIHAINVLKNNNCSNIKILHCVSCYPAPPEGCNLSAIETIRKETSCDVGWSDHTVKPFIIHRAVHRWNAKVVEFHLDLDGKGKEFESGHCWLPEQIREVIHGIRNAIETDGNGKKEPILDELIERDWRADPTDGLRPLLKTRYLLDKKK